MQVFGVPLVSASWVLNAYVIAMAIGLIMVSYLATIFCPKNIVFDCPCDLWFGVNDGLFFTQY